MTKLSKMIFERELTHQYIADLLGVSPAHVSLLRNGHRRMTSAIMMRLCDILSCEPKDIYDPPQINETNTDNHGQKQIN